MRKRIILIVLVVGIAAGICGGIWVYVRYNSYWRIQARMNLAMQANQFEKAAGYARTYIEQRPTAWEGYYWLAECYVRMGRYEEARKEIRGILEKPNKMGCDEVTVRLLMADSYAHAAYQSMSASGAREQRPVLTAAIELLKLANEELQAAPTDKPDKAMDVQQSHGRNCIQIGVIYEQLATLCDKAVRLAEEQGNAAKAKEEKDQAKGLRDLAAKAHGEAIALLLKVVQQDPKRAQPASGLVQLCLKQNDRASLDLARTAIGALEDPPATAAMMLAIDEAQQALNPRLSPDQQRKILKDLCDRLDKILAQHPGELEVKASRAEYALRLNDEATAEKLCKEVLAKDPRQSHARMITAQLMARKGNIVDAEQELFALKTDTGSPEALYLYAQAALASGKRELARQSLRQLTALNVGNPYERSFVAKAYKYLADSLVQDGFPAQAFDDAQQYYRLFPDDPAAVVLYIDLAKRSDQGNLAREQLKKIEADKEKMKRPEMLVAVAQGYLLLGEPEDKKKSDDLVQMIHQLKPETPEGKLAVARALRMAGQLGQAETALKEFIAESTELPLAEGSAELGNLYVQQGRMLEAIELFRAAVRQDPVNSAYKSSLARALFEAGDLEECESTLAGMDPYSAVANLLRLQVQIAKGEAGDSNQMLQQVMQAGISGLPAAVAYMNNGQPGQCIDVCQTELKKRTSDEVYLRSLMGQAYLSVGDRDKCVGEWKQVITLSPTQMSMYMSLMALLAQDPDPAKPADPDRAAADMAKIANARADLIQFAHAWLLDRLHKYPEAAEKFRQLAEKADCSEPVRDRARLRAANALAKADQVDAALAELDRLVLKPQWQKEAMYQKAQILLSAGRKSDVRTVLNSLRAQAVKERDDVLLRRVIALHLASGSPDDALGACDQLLAMLPNEPRGPLIKAETLAAAGRGAEAVTAFETALKREPGNFTTYLKLSHALDAQQKSVEALKALDRLAQFGEVGRAESVFQRGQLLAQWGLQNQAVDCFASLDKNNSLMNPRLQFALGRDMMALGRSDNAQAILAKIPTYAKEYVAAQLLLTRLATTPDAKLKILDDLETRKPGLPAVLQERMSIQIQSERFDEAVKAYQAFVARLPKGQQSPANLSYAAVMALLQSGQQPAALEMVTQLAKQSRSALWRKYELFLKAESDPKAAVSLLPDVAKADGQDASIGLCLAAELNAPDDIKKWNARLTDVEAQLARQKSPRTIPKVYKLLVSLVNKDIAGAKACLEKLDPSETTVRTTAAELVAASEAGTSTPAEAAKLLRAFIADEIGLPYLTTRCGMDLLKARPTCQMAAALAFRGQTTAAGRKAILDTLKPADCPFAKEVQAFLAAQDKQYQQAAKLLGEACVAEGNNVELMVQQAVALENAGKAAEALPLYLKAWELGKSIVAANNAAYLITQLYETNDGKLAEAETMIAEAIKVSPNTAAIQETLGWIQYLRGQKERACTQLRSAIRGVPDSPEAHYHLGAAEAALGNLDMARFHLEQAVTFAEKMKKEGAATVGTDKALVLAQQMIKTLPAPKT